MTIPGFGTDSPASDPPAAGHASSKQRPALGVTIVATATSGGAFEPYKNLLRGEKYTTYVDTSLGTVVMEFADEAAAGHPYGATLAAPVGIRTDLADGLPRARMVLTCTLDASGNLKNVRVLEARPCRYDCENSRRSAQLEIPTGHARQPTSGSHRDSGLRH